MVEYKELSSRDYQFVIMTEVIREEVNDRLILEQIGDIVLNELLETFRNVEYRIITLKTPGIIAPDELGPILIHWHVEGLKTVTHKQLSDMRDRINDLTGVSVVELSAGMRDKIPSHMVEYETSGGPSMPGVGPDNPLEGMTIEELIDEVENGDLSEDEWDNGK